MINNIKRLSVVATLSLGVTANANAITWADTEHDDPFSDEKCHVQEPMSSGSYIYDYPSKFDGVYWPHTDPSWVWLCPASGYVAFGDEFDDIDESRRDDIAAWLASQPPVADNALAKIDRLEDLEQFRTRIAPEAAWFKRLMAHWRADSDPSRADALRRESIPLMLEALELTDIGLDRIQLMFLLGAYAEKFESPSAADEWFAKARSEKWTDEDDNEQTGLDYFNDLIAEIVSRR